jgi:ribulose-5-phosphate 4-epimerase/fuculose-1-phosphate aldolase
MQAAKVKEAEFRQRAAELMEAGRLLYARGMVPATSGNFSVRLSSGELAITVSGSHKGRLGDTDIMRVDAEGRSELNEMSWIYVRPGEQRSCLGCHHPDSAPAGPATPHPHFTGCLKCHNDSVN